MKPLCILVAGDPVLPTRQRVGGFGALIRSATGEAWQGAWQEVDARRDEVVLPAATAVSGVVITGSASSVTEHAPWMLRAQAWLAGIVADGVPVLGLCFGHQMLAEALGGKVAENPRGREMGTVQLELTAPDELLDGVGAEVNMSHRDSVVALPPGALELARTERDPRAAIRFAPRTWGVQFHPEFDGQVMREYIGERRDALTREGHDPDALLGAARTCPDSARVLRRFAALCTGS